MATTTIPNELQNARKLLDLKEKIFNSQFISVKALGDSRQELADAIIQDKAMAKAAMKLFDVAKMVDNANRPVAFAAIEHHREAAVIALSDNDPQILSIVDAATGRNLNQRIRELYTLNLERRF